MDAGLIEVNDSTLQEDCKDRGRTEPLAEGEMKLLRSQYSRF